MGTADGTVVDTTKVVDHGPDADRYNVVLMGDGFRADQQAAYQTAVTAISTKLENTEPFRTAWDRINVHRVNVHSDETGADNPATCGDGSTPASGSATTARTYFDASFCNNGIRRLLQVDPALVVTTANAQVPGWDAIIVVVNHTEYGGSGGTDVAVYSVAAGADEIGLHELGHSAFGLADEYEYYAGCSSGETDHNDHPGPEPTQPNVTRVKDRATLKWRHLVDKATSIPTTTNADCTKCDTQANPVTATTIGAFEGAHYYHCKAYRPAFDCRMRTIGQEFCGVCQEAIRKKIAAGSTTPSSTCFVASAVYREELHPDVVQLRRWRDRAIAGGGARGRLMAAANATYRVVGPPAAGFTARHPVLGDRLRRGVFEPGVARLRRRAGTLPPAPVGAVAAREAR